MSEPESAAEARGDTKLARMEGKLDLVVSKIDLVNARFNELKADNRATRALIAGISVLVIAIVFCVARLTNNVHVEAPTSPAAHSPPAPEVQPAPKAQPSPAPFTAVPPPQRR